MDPELSAMIADPGKVRRAILGVKEEKPLTEGQTDLAEVIELDPASVPLPRLSEDELYPEDSASAAGGLSPSSLEVVSTRVAILETRSDDLQAFVDEHFRNVADRLSKIEGLLTKMSLGGHVKRQSLGGSPLGKSVETTAPDPHQEASESTTSISIDSIKIVSSFLDDHRSYPSLKVVRTALLHTLGKRLDRVLLRDVSTNQWTINGILSAYVDNE